MLIRPPVFIIIKPKKILPVSCTITVSDPVSYCTEPEIHHHDITKGFVKTFMIKSDYEDQYQYDASLMDLGFHVWFGDGQFKKKYKEIDPKYYSVHVYTKNNITFELKPNLDLAQFPSNSNNFIFDIPYCGKYVYGATVKLLDNDQFMSVSNLFKQSQTDFGITFALFLFII